MIMSIKDLGEGGILIGSGFAPWPLAIQINNLFKSVDIMNFIMVFSAIAGVTLCVWVCRYFICKPWPVKISAVVICSMAWSFSNTHDYVLYAIPLTAVFVFYIKNKLPGKWVFAGFSAVFACSAIVITQIGAIANFTGIPMETLRIPLFVMRTVFIPLSWALPLLALLGGVNNNKSFLEIIRFYTKSKQI